MFTVKKMKATRMAHDFRACTKGHLCFLRILRHSIANLEAGRGGFHDIVA
jgi:hypothetical protein